MGVPPISFSADFGAAGLRLQGTGGVRPFFDIGLAVGRDQHFRGGGGGLGGIVLGAGVRIPLGKHWYVRPQVRFYGLAGKDAGHQAFSAGAGIGYRF